MTSLTLRRIYHDRAHYAPPGGHKACKTTSCAADEQRTIEHRIKYNYPSRPTYAPYYYNGTSVCAEIKAGRQYLCNIGGVWHLGTFSKQWYGWNFWPWGTSGIQLSGIWEVYEATGFPRRTQDPHKPPPLAGCDCGCDDNGDHRRVSPPYLCMDCTEECATTRAVRSA